MKKLLLILLCLPLLFTTCKKEEEDPANNGNNNGQTYVPNTYFEQRLIDLGLDETLDDYVLTGNINDLEALDVSGENISDLTGIEDFTALITLYCQSNQLTSLDVSQNIALTNLYCYNNQLTTLDVSQNTTLTRLHLHSNQLTSLDLRNGNNEILWDVDFGWGASTYNPNLICISVDNAVWSTDNWVLPNNSPHYFSENCP